MRTSFKYRPKVLLKSLDNGGYFIRGGQRLRPEMFCDNDNLVLVYSHLKILRTFLQIDNFSNFIIKKMLMDPSFVEMAASSHDASELLNRILCHSKFRRYFGTYFNYTETSSFRSESSIAEEGFDSTAASGYSFTSTLKSVRRRGNKLLGTISKLSRSISRDPDEMTISGPSNPVQHYHATMDEDGRLTGLPSDMELKSQVSLCIA